MCKARFTSVCPSGALRVLSPISHVRPRLREVGSLVQSHLDSPHSLEPTGISVLSLWAPSCVSNPAPLCPLAPGLLSYRARMVLLLQPKRRKTTSLKSSLPVQPRRGPKPRRLLLPGVVGLRRCLNPWPGRQRPPRARGGQACPPRPHRPNWPAGRRRLEARAGVETRRSCPSFYSPTNHHSIYFFVTYLSIKAFFPSQIDVGGG